MPGCMEHTGMVSQLIREARENNGNLAVLWLDLANTYGSIPHKVVEETLCRYHVLSFVSNLILDYYYNFTLRVTSGTKTSDWHRLERGIITSCTISATVLPCDEYDNQVSRSGVSESNGKVQHSAASIESIHGWYYSDNIISHRLQVDSKGLRKIHSMGPHEV